MISFKDFSKLELKVGTVLEAQVVAGSERLIKLMVDLGEKKPRQILVGIRKWYSPQSLIGEQVVVAANLEPKVFMGLESQGMVLCADSDKPILLRPLEVPLGTKIK